MNNSSDLIRISDLISSQGQFDDKCGALPKLAFDGNNAAVGTEDLSGDIEAKTKTAKAVD